MKMRAAWGLVVVLALALVLMAHGDEKAAECDALGFDAATLSCSSCTLLPTYSPSCFILPHRLLPKETKH
jgi:hypothetical protein